MRARAAAREDTHVLAISKEERLSGGREQKPHFCFCLNSHWCTGAHSSAEEVHSSRQSLQTTLRVQSGQSSAAWADHRSP